MFNTANIHIGQNVMFMTKFSSNYWFFFKKISFLGYWHCGCDYSWNPQRIDKSTFGCAWHHCHYMLCQCLFHRSYHSIGSCVLFCSKILCSYSSSGIYFFRIFTHFAMKWWNRGLLKLEKSVLLKCLTVFAFIFFFVISRRHFSGTTLQAFSS